MKLLKLYKASFAGLPTEIWFLSFVMFINRAGAMVLPFMSLYLKKDLGYELSEIGLIMMALGLGSMTGSYIGGKLVDRFGQYYVQIFSLIGTGIIFFIFPLLDGLVELILGMFFLTAVADCFRPANMAAMAIYSSPVLQTRAITLNRLAINLGFAFGPGLAGILAGKFGYYLLFYVDGVTCIVAAILIFLFLERKEEKRTTAAERKTVYKEVLYKDKTYHIFLFLVLIVSICFIQFFSTIPVFWEEQLGLTETQIGMWLGFNGFLIFLVEMPIIYVLEGKGIGKLRIIKYGVFLIALSFFSFLLPLNPIMVVLSFVFFITIGEILALPFQSSYALNRAEPSIRGSYMGWYGITWSVAQVIGPPIGFLIADNFGFNVLWFLIGVATLLACVGYGILGKYEKEKGPKH